MASNVAIIGIIVEDRSQSSSINEILHENAMFVVGRMGLPYHKRNLSIISVVVDAPKGVIDEMTGKIEKVPGVSAKTVYSHISNI